MEAGTPTGGTGGSGGVASPIVGGSSASGLSGGGTSSGGGSSGGAGGTNATMGGGGARSTGGSEHELDASATSRQKDSSVDSSDDGSTEAGSTLPSCSGANVPIWYQDCDGDGYAASVTDGAVSSCVSPPTSASCIGWTRLKPADKTSTDCNDRSAAYHPGADFDFPFTPSNLPPADSVEYDLNCDGKAELEPHYTLGPFAIFDFGSPKQYVSFCGDADSTGCCVTSTQGAAFCCGCNMGVHVECGSYRGDTSGYFLCR
jgi:hypothetical protein